MGRLYTQDSYIGISYIHKVLQYVHQSMHTVLYCL